MEHTHEISPGQKAYTKFEMDYFANARAIGDMVHGVFDTEKIRATMHNLEESTFEAVEAGCFNEIEGLTQLLQELESNSSALRDHRIDDLANETDIRIRTVRERLEVLIAERNNRDAYYQAAL